MDKKEILIMAELNKCILEAHICKGFQRQEALKIVTSSGMKFSDITAKRSDPAKS